MRITFAINFLLALMLVFVISGVTFMPLNPFTFTFGFFANYFVLWFISRFYDKKHYIRVPRIVNLVLFFIKALFKANLKVAIDVITPVNDFRPGVIALPLDVKTDLEITIFANLISLTPGTLSLDVSKDKKTLYVHAVYIERDDVEGFKKELKEGFEKKILGITR
jgi:multicomponent Na+:H+ antiporter subunit E